MNSYVAFDERPAIFAALGEELPAYIAWKSAQIDAEIRREFAIVEPDEYRQELLAVDFDDENSLYDFYQFSLRPAITPIVIGKVNNTLLRLSAGPSLLEPHDLGHQLVSDERPFVELTVLGLYEDLASYSHGSHVDEGYFSEDTSPVEPNPSLRLEIFHQLGLVEYREPNARGPEAWCKSNYALVQNTDDHSIWVLWRKYIFLEGAMDQSLAKDVMPSEEYAVFPGTSYWKQKIIYAKLAEHSLGPDITLDMTHIYPDPSAEGPAEEPFVVAVRRTKEGGLRRSNDFRPKLARHKT